MSTDGLALTLSNVTKSYGKGQKAVLAVENVSLTAAKGLVTGLLGLNGAGKSTILKIMAGVHRQDAGSVTVAGCSEDAGIRRRVGFVPEYPELDPILTVRETLMLEQELFSCSGNLEWAAGQAGLEDVLDKKNGSLSKGYRQRVSFAKALSHKPQVLILDEYSGGLDPSQIIMIQKSIRNYARSNAVILSTHHIPDAESLCDYVYIMNSGKVAASGTIEELVSNSGKNSLEEAFMFYTQNSRRPI